MTCTIRFPDDAPAVALLRSVGSDYNQLAGLSVADAWTLMIRIALLLTDIAAELGLPTDTHRPALNRLPERCEIWGRAAMGRASRSYTGTGRLEFILILEYTTERIGREEIQALQWALALGGILVTN